MSHHWRSYAKINLYLDVLRRRRDGYHNIETVFQSVSLYDELAFSEHPEDIVLTCSLPGLDTGASNLICRAAALLKKSTGCTKGARIHLQKNIPLAAGLAGGSGNAAAALAALNRLWQLELPPARLLACARKLGADVSFCLSGGTQAATLKGEVLYPLPPLPPVFFVLIHPDIQVSTPFIYTHPLLRRSNARPVAGLSSSFRRALRALKKNNWQHLVFNGMEAPAFSEYPQLAELKEQLMERGCDAAAMSGSGPTLFGLFELREKAEQAIAFFQQQYPSLRLTLVQPSSKGVTYFRESFSEP